MSLVEKTREALRDRLIEAFLLVVIVPAGLSTRFADASSLTIEKELHAAKYEIRVACDKAPLEGVQLTVQLSPAAFLEAYSVDDLAGARARLPSKPVGRPATFFEIGTSSSAMAFDEAWLLSGSPSLESAFLRFRSKSVNATSGDALIVFVVRLVLGLVALVLIAYRVKVHLADRRKKRQRQEQLKAGREVAAQALRDPAVYQRIRQAFEPHIRSKIAFFPTAPLNTSALVDLSLWCALKHVETGEHELPTAIDLCVKEELLIALRNAK